MQNVDLEVTEGGQLVITIDLNQELGLSQSGKSTLIATTGGNVSVPECEDIKFGLTVYRPATARSSRRR